MRTLVRLPATSTLLLGLAFTPALAEPPAVTSEPLSASTPASEIAAVPRTVPDIRLVRLASQPRPGGGQRVHYGVFQRVQPLLAVNVEVAPGSDAIVSSSDAVAVSYEFESDGWEPLAMLTVDEFGPPAPVIQSPATVASTLAEPSEPQVLAIAPVRPDPVRGGALVVDVTLPGAGPARLEMLDVMGRRVASRDLGSLGAGRHAVDMGAERRFAPGVYLLRLTRADDARVVRVTVID